VGLLASCGVVYWIGAGVFTLLVVAQHFMVTPSNQGRLNQAFWLNQIASMVFCSLWIADILLK
jgi:4-hydroxybenzoate polyprenyltransferase